MNKNLSPKTNWFAVACLLLVLMLTLKAILDFRKMWIEEDLLPSSGLTRFVYLHEYHAPLEETYGDTKVYFFEGKKPGGTVLLLGGTHPNEAAGFVTAYLMLENLSVSAGRIIIIPQANHSAFTHNDPQEGYPQFFEIEGVRGKRKFRYGSRITNPVNQWPDPDIYLHYPSGQKLAGNETRNLNRAYPGRPDGNLTEQVAYAIVNLISEEKVDIAIDLHEAAPEYPVVNAIVSTARSQDLATEAALELAFEDLKYSLEPSPYNFRGLSHREWENFTSTFPVLMETANPIQGRLRGKTDEQLILSGQDKMYQVAARLGVLAVPYDSSGLALNLRVARHAEAFHKIVEVFSRNYPEQAIAFSGFPHYFEILEHGIQKYF
ncbi:MAG: succinylglutamate desuccinylase/aspartoacylase family protein [bacterium]|nr:MAG: succinylglutamate desuccinylase/aspartoacylase family protein [bacterium]